MTLIDQVWIKEHKPADPTKCIRCGGCCKAIPCYYAQIWHGLKKETDKCPDLREEKDGRYTCLMMGRDDGMRYAMKGTGCFYPEWRKGEEGNEMSRM